MASLSNAPQRETFYMVLEINQDASKQEIRESYKRLAILLHPDKNMGDFANACTAFQKLQAAFSILSDPLSRAQYDKTLGIESPVSDLDTQAPESPRPDFSDKEMSAPGSSRPQASNVKSSAATYPRSRPTAEYDDSNDGDADDEEPDKDDKKMEWRTEAWLNEAIRESMLKLGELLKEMKVLAERDYYNDQWVELKAKVNSEKRYQDGLRKDLSKLARDE